MSDKSVSKGSSCVTLDSGRPVMYAVGDLTTRILCKFCYEDFAMGGFAKHYNDHCNEKKTVEACFAAGIDLAGLGLVSQQGRLVVDYHPHLVGVPTGINMARLQHVTEGNMSLYDYQAWTKRQASKRLAKIKAAKALLDQKTTKRVAAVRAKARVIAPTKQPTSTVAMPSMAPAAQLPYSVPPLDAEYPVKMMFCLKHFAECGYASHRDMMMEFYRDDWAAHSDDRLCKEGKAMSVMSVKAIMSNTDTCIDAQEKRVKMGTCWSKSSRGRFLDRAHIDPWPCEAVEVLI